MDRNRDSTGIDEYIASFPEGTQKKLIQLRKLIRQTAPNAEERISYRMPAFFLDGVLVWFAAYAKHIGFYPKASAIAQFKHELSRYKHATGSVQFPLDTPLPVELIRRMVRFRVREISRKRKLNSL